MFLLNLENTQTTFLGYLRNAGSEKIFMSLLVESLFKSLSCSMGLSLFYSPKHSLFSYTLL